MVNSWLFQHLLFETPADQTPDEIEVASGSAGSEDLVAGELPAQAATVW